VLGIKLPVGLARPGGPSQSRPNLVLSGQLWWCRQAHVPPPPSPSLTPFLCLCACTQTCCKEGSSRDRGVSYASALVSPHQPLKGAPTYRLPLHPRYKAQFANGMFVPVWLKMFGRATYTRLVGGWAWCRGGLRTRTM